MEQFTSSVKSALVYLHDDIDEATRNFWNRVVSYLVSGLTEGDDDAALANKAAAAIKEYSQAMGASAADAKDQLLDRLETIKDVDELEALLDEADGIDAQGAYEKLEAAVMHA